MTIPLAAWLAAAAWTVVVVVAIWRFRASRSLAEHDPDPAAGAAPLVSVIIPARDEARNIVACLEAVLASRWPALEVLVVDDRSADGTGELARAIAAHDPRVRVLDAPPLPDDWFGKQWACHTGAQAARGDLLCFTDADTRHGPELLGRSVRALRDRGADLLTVAGRQEMHTFWEKVVQPYVFAVLLLRYGGMEAMSRSTDPRRKIANGQYLLFTREAYERAGGHHAVRDHVAEDLLLAQRLTALGMRVHMLLAREHLATRMYASLAEIRAGWGKNVFAAGRDTLPANRLVRALFPFALPKVVLLPAWPAYAALVGWLVLQAIPLLPVPAGAALRGIAIAVFWAGALAAPVNLVAWMAVYVFSRLHPLWALLHPLGGLVFSWICVEAAVRGDRVSWKGRTYGSPAHAAARAVRPPGSA